MAKKVTVEPLIVEHEEYQYLRFVNDIIEYGVERSDRTGVGTLAKFGGQMRYWV